MSCFSRINGVTDFLHDINCQLTYEFIKKSFCAVNYPAIHITDGPSHIVNADVDIAQLIRPEQLKMCRCPDIVIEYINNLLDGSLRFRFISLFH